MLTSSADADDIEAALVAGANDYVRKPFQVVEFLARVTTLARVRSLYESAWRAEQERAAALARERTRIEFEQLLIGIVSHDLRNPITAISLAADLLKRGAALDPTQTMMLAERIKSSSARALRMILDLLDFTQARIGGGLPVTVLPMDLAELVRQVVSETSLAYPARHIHLEADGDATGVWDSDRMAQVITNLLSNALYYSPKDTTVVASVRGEPEFVCLTIYNEGRPIPPALLARLFAPMERGGQAVDPSTRSIGLGLYIVDQIVRAHLGVVHVQSVEGKGTTFMVRLPRTAAVVKDGTSTPA